MIDWRARAAEPFYRATPADPMEVIRRRVLRSRGEKVIGIEDDLLDTDSDTDLVVLGEGALMAALSRARGSQMKDIVATIQAEQDEAIRAPYSGRRSSAAVRAPARPWSPCTVRPICCTPTGVGSDPVVCWWSGPARSS